MIFYRKVDELTQFFEEIDFRVKITLLLKYAESEPIFVMESEQ